MTVVGSAYIRLLPMADGFADAAKAELQPELDAIAEQTAASQEAAGATAGEALAGGMGTGMRSKEEDVKSAGADLAGAGATGARDLETETEKIGKDAGDKMSGALGKAGGLISNALGMIGLNFGKAGDASEKMASKVASAGNDSGGAMSKLAGIGKLATGVLIIGAVAAGAAALNLANNFEDSTNKLAASAGISDAAAARIGNAFLTTGGQTIYTGQQMVAAITPVAGLLNNLGDGAMNASQSLAFMKVAADLAEGSNTSLGDATSTLATTLKTFGANAKDAGMYGDVLFNTSRVLGTSIDTVGGTFNKLRATLGDVTPDVGQLGGILVDLSDHGLSNVRKATAALNTSLNGLLLPSKAVQKAQDDLGLSVFNAQGQFVGFGSLVDQLQPKLAAMSQQQQIATLKAVGFGNSAKAILPTILAGSAAFDKATDAASRQGSAQQAAAKQSQSLGHEWLELKVAAQDLATQVGEKLLPYVKEFLGWIVKGADYLLAHKTLLLAIVAALGALIAVPILVFLGGLIASISPIALALAAVAAGAVLLATHWKQVWTDIKNWFDDAVRFIRDHAALIATIPIIGPLLVIATHWQEIWRAMRQVVSDVVDAVRPYMSSLTQIVVGTFEGIRTVLAGVFGTIEAIVKTAWGVVTAVFQTAVGIVEGIIKVFAALFTGNWTALWNGITGIFRTIWSGLQGVIMSVFNGLVGFFTSIWQTITGVFHSAVSTIEGVLSAAWVTVGGAISSAWSGIVSFFTGIPGDILHALGAAGGILLQWGKDLVGGIVTGIGSAAKDIGDALKNAIVSGWNLVKSTINSIPVVGSVLSHIPGLAIGGYVAKPTLALVGEAGPEFVIPESMLAGQFAAGVSPLPAGLSAGLAGGAGGGAVSVTAAPHAAPGPSSMQLLIEMARLQNQLLQELIDVEKSPGTLTLLGQLPGADAVQQIATGIAR